MPDRGAPWGSERTRVALYGCGSHLSRTVTRKLYVGLSDCYKTTCFDVELVYQHGMVREYFLCPGCHGI
jgi:hypothetical protein